MWDWSSSHASSGDLPMSSKPAISVCHVSKVYALGLSGRSTRSLPAILRERARRPIRGNGRRKERLQALDDVSFDVRPGEAVGIVGNNGAGKSTLLKILSRITPPTSGHIDIQGSVGSLLEVGTGFHPELTGLETCISMARSSACQRGRSSDGWRRSSPSQKWTDL